jgi:VWFA-related protein
MSRILRLSCGVTVALGIAGTLQVALPAAQPQAPTFKSGTALVEVDAIILAKGDRFVSGLRAEDLEIFEDGKRQTIQQFYLVSNPLGARAETVSESLTSPTETRRVFVLLFDEAHLANDALLRAKEGAQAFIRDQVGPDDVGGVFVNNGMFKGRLTSDKEELLAGVRMIRPAFDNRQALLAPFGEFPRIPSEVDAARIADGARELVDSLGVQACRQDPGDCETAGGLNQVENQIQQKARLYVRQARMLAGQTMQNLQTVARGLSRIPGRKTVIFMSEGFFVEDSRGALQMVAAQAARGGTTIYSIDPRGLINSMSPNPDVARRERARSTAFDTGEDGPTILTAGTGGVMVQNIDDLSRAFGLIVRDTSTYYVIGYQPDNAVMDGKFRKIEVRVKAGGLKVRARRGYMAVALPPQQTLWGGGR